MRHSWSQEEVNQTQATLSLRGFIIWLGTESLDTTKNFQKFSSKLEPEDIKIESRAVWESVREKLFNSNLSKLLFYVGYFHFTLLLSAN